MNDEELESLTVAVQELLATADDPQPDTIAIPDDAAERLGLVRGSAYSLAAAVGCVDEQFARLVEWGARYEIERVRERLAQAVAERYRTPQRIFDRADYSKLSGKRFDLALTDDLIPTVRISREGVKTYLVSRVDERWTISSAGRNSDQLWHEIDEAIAGAPEIIEVHTPQPYRISAATLAFCLGGCILHGET